MTPQQRFAQDFNTNLVEIRYFNNMRTLYAQAATHAHNGDTFPESPNLTKEQAAKEWEKQADQYAHNMAVTAAQWGCQLDFSPGLFPTLIKNNERIHFPWSE